MKRNILYQYLVEGDTERKVIQTLKGEMNLIIPGKVQRLNVVQEEISDFYLRTIKPGTVVVVVFDTDTENVDILHKNFRKLAKAPTIRKVVTIPQVKNLEDELVYSCSITKITDLLNSNSVAGFKSDLLKISNLSNKLAEKSFDIERFWSRNPSKPYDNIANESKSVKFTVKK